MLVGSKHMVCTKNTECENNDYYEYSCDVESQEESKR